MGRDSRARRRHHQRAGVGRGHQGYLGRDPIMDALTVSLMRGAADLWPAMVNRIGRAGTRTPRGSGR